MLTEYNNFWITKFRELKKNCKVEMVKMFKTNILRQTQLCLIKLFGIFYYFFFIGKKNGLTENSQ